MAESVFDARAHWTAMMATGEAVLALKRARDMVVMAHGSTTAAASVNVLFEAANGLLREMGAQLVALRDCPDAEVRAFVALVLDRLHGPLAERVPLDPESPA